MPHYVIVSGLPKTVKKQKMVHFLRQFIFKRPPVKFWIESLSTAPDSSNQMIIRFESRLDAENAEASFQDYPFQHTDQQIYLLKSYLKDEQELPDVVSNDHEPERDEPVEYPRSQSPVRSRSPHIKEELTKIQLEIELTNKKRMLVEAEQKLILEQNRLEMLQKAGSSNVDLEESKVKMINMPKKEHKRPQDQNNKAVENRGCNLYWPCRIIGKEMKLYVKMHINLDMRPTFYALMRIHIKQRFKEVLQGIATSNTKKIIAMYRQVHPAHTDEKFVLTLRDMVRQGQLPEELLQRFSNKMGQQNTGSVNDDPITAADTGNIDPIDLPIHELSNDLDDWIEDSDVKN